MRRLFVGGPWHGQVHDISNPNRPYVVPGPIEVQAHNHINGGWDLVPDFDVDRVTYNPQKIGSPLALLPVMVDSRVPFYGDQLDRAEAMASVLRAVGVALDVQILTPGVTVSNMTPE